MAASPALPYPPQQATPSHCEPYRPSLPYAVSICAFVSTEQRGDLGTGCTEGAHCVYRHLHLTAIFACESTDQWKQGRLREFWPWLGKEDTPKRRACKQLGYLQDCRLMLLLDLLMCSIWVAPGWRGGVTKCMPKKLIWPQISSYVTITGASQENGICTG